VRLKGFCQAPLCMVMDYMELGNLMGLIKDSSKQIDWNLRLKIAADVARGMTFVHGITPPILHRNLKPSNILLTAESDDSNVPMTAKVMNIS
jgi:serine/threonine protein kinase